MTSFSRRQFALGLATLASCGRVGEEGKIVAPPDAGGPDAAPPNFFASSDAAPPACVLPTFADEALFNARPARKTLYTWTTKEQADALVASPTLYTKMADGYGNKGFLFDLLEKRAGQGDGTAKILTQPDFMTGRYAWPVLWGALHDCEDYGRELVRVDLMADARFVVMADTQPSTPYRVVDIDNVDVPLATALAEPQRIAGVFFNNDACGNCGSIGGRFGYREFHLCHESTVAEWSLRTPDLLARIESAIATLTPLRPSFDDCLSASTCEETVKTWNRAAATTDHDRLLASLAFGWTRNLELIIGRLKDARFTPAPFTHRPNG